jgi:hypothetical protein
MNTLQDYAYTHPLSRAHQIDRRHFEIIGHGLSIGLSLNK